MSALAVLARPLHQPGGGQVRAPERCVAAQPPRVGAVTQAPLAGLADSRRSRVDLPDVRLLRAGEALRGLAASHESVRDGPFSAADEAARCAAEPERCASAVLRTVTMPPTRALHLAAVPSGKRCVCAMVPRREGLRV